MLYCAIEKLMDELRATIVKFSCSCWGLIGTPAQAWLNGSIDNAELIVAIKQAETASNGYDCKFAPYFKKAIELLEEK